MGLIKPPHDLEPITSLNFVSGSLLVGNENTLVRFTLADRKIFKILTMIKRIMTVSFIDDYLILVKQCGGIISFVRVSDMSLVK
jgi:hypothetical protein